ncbi:MAG TPA: baseplate J/gp47 family protein [Chloroflexia bacterium]|jgi:hypothetical protein
MSIVVPELDNRRYQDLLDEALARIPVYTPEWTNFNKSDPGVTLIEVFAFMVENLLYRANYIPERNRLKFLSLLGLPLHPGATARGVVTFNNERGPLRAVTLNAGLEVRAGAVPFRTELGVDVLPIETQLYTKRALENPSEAIRQYYKQLYSSYIGASTLDTSDPPLYETVLFAPRGSNSIDLSTTIDGSLWIALLARAGDRPFTEDRMEEIREQLGGRILSLGFIPVLSDPNKTLPPGGYAEPQRESLLRYQMPLVPPDRMLPLTLSERVPRYQTLEATSQDNVLSGPGIVQITLPGDDGLRLWSNLDPLEAGVGDFPPSLEDTELNERLITWVRVIADAKAQARFQWVGSNATFVAQRARVTNELLPGGTGEPGQLVVLSHRPVIADSVLLTVTANGSTETWQRIDDLLSAGPEVPAPDPRVPQGTPVRTDLPSKVYTLNPESAEIQFGDGTRGARPPFGAVLRVSYDYSEGNEGNVGTGAVNNSPALPAGIRVTNPAPTWGGAEPETAADGEKQITRYLQHRDRLVNTGDFETIVRRTPGVSVGRVEVLPAFNPELALAEPGGAPGAVTLMLIPGYDAANPNAPMPDRLFMDAVCAYIDSRRLVTTEVFLRPPTYRNVWVSVGISPVARVGLAQVIADVKAAVTAFLSPLPLKTTGAAAPAPVPGQPLPVDPGTPVLYASGVDVDQGWALGKPVLKLELMAVVSRVPGVLLVRDLLLVDENGATRDDIPMSGLDLPRLMGVSVGPGDPVGTDQLPGLGSTTEPTASSAFVPLPVVPEECR